MLGEEKIPHHYSDIQEIEEIYSENVVGITPYTYSFMDSDNITHFIKAFVVIVRKK